MVMAKNKVQHNSLNKKRGVLHEDVEQWRNDSKGQNLEEWKATCPNTLSERMMESLICICDTLLPSVDVSKHTMNEDLKTFYATSAAMGGVPEHVGSLLSGGMKHPAIWSCRLALWFLSTWYGTLILCGTASLSQEFPYVQKFSRVERKKREKILLSWSLSSINIFRMLFKSVKYLIMRTYFTQINEKHQNPSWKAIHYPGPDTSLTAQNKTAIKNPESPLDRIVIPLKSPTKQLKFKLPKSLLPSPFIFSGELSGESPKLRCDAVIVGSGSGGSVVASVLSKAGHKVLVVEKGDYYPRSELSLLEGPTVQRIYEGGGLIATDNLSALLLAGATVGGGSTVNWAASLRTPDHVRQEWCEALGLELFGSSAFDSALDAVCDRISVQCSGAHEEGLNNMVLRKGCGKLGLEVSNVPCNAPKDHYCGWCHLGCKNGKKKSATETWLLDLASSGNGFVLTGCEAVKVLVSNDEKKRRVSRGVIVRSSSGAEFVIESRVTVVACGALNTPSLLRKSGLKNPNIGRNLHVHPTSMAWGYFPSDSWPEEEKKSFEGGILTAMSRNCGTLMQTPALHPGMFATVTPWVSPEDFRGRMCRFSRTVHMFSMVRDRGSGFANYPKSVSYDLDGEDEKKLQEGLGLMLRVLAAAGAVEVGTQHVEGERAKVGVNGGEELEKLVQKVRKRGLRDGKTQVTTAHQMGSCRMGKDWRSGAVQSTGESWEVEGLYLADTSVFPTALGVNPMVTVQAIAYCLAQSIIAVLHGGE